MLTDPQRGKVRVQAFIQVPSAFICRTSSARGAEGGVSVFCAGQKQRQLCRLRSRWSCGGSYSALRCTSVGSRTNSSWCFYLGLLYLLRQLTLLLDKTYSLGTCSVRVQAASLEIPLLLRQQLTLPRLLGSAGLLRSASHLVPGLIKVDRQQPWFFAPASRAAAIYHTQGSTPSWLRSCCLVAVTVTNSKARSTLQTFAFGAVCWAAVRNPAVLARPDSIDTRTWGPPWCSSCNAFNQSKRRFCQQSYVDAGKYYQDGTPLWARKSVSCIDLNIKATEKFSVFLQKLNPSDFLQDFGNEQLQKTKITKPFNLRQEMPKIH